MRRRQKLRLGWLLVPLIVGLPTVVFFVSQSRIESPAVSPAVADVLRSFESDTPEMVEHTGEAEPEALPENPALVSPEEPPMEAPRGNPSDALSPTPSPSVSPSKAANAEPAPAHPPNPDWGRIAGNPESWPENTRLKVPVDFPITIGGKTSGATRVQPGTTVKVLKILPEGVDVGFAESSVRLEVEKTTLPEQLSEARDRQEKKPTEPRVPEPSPSAPPQSKATSIAPRPKWENPPAGERMNLIELLRAIEHETQPDGSLEVADFPEIYKGVTLLMPLPEALKKLGLSRESIPSKTPVSHPGIPFYFRSFPAKYALVDEPEDFFSQICILTDAEDRVVGIQLECDNPHSKYGPVEEDFLTYNFVLNRKKTVTKLKAGCTTTPSGAGLLVVETRLVDESRNKTLEIVRWYLPKKVANFLRHVTETRLGLDG